METIILMGIGLLAVGIFAIVFARSQATRGFRTRRCLHCRGARGT